MRKKLINSIENGCLLVARVVALVLVEVVRDTFVPHNV